MIKLLPLFSPQTSVALVLILEPYFYSAFMNYVFMVGSNMNYLEKRHLRGKKVSKSNPKGSYFSPPFLQDLNPIYLQVTQTIDEINKGTEKISDILEDMDESASTITHSNNTIKGNTIGLTYKKSNLSN